MSSILPLLQNENMKIYRRMRTWIMFGLLIGFLILVFSIDKAYERKVDDQNWKADLILQNQQHQNSLENMGDNNNASYVKYMKNTILTNDYRIAHDLNPQIKTLWNIVINSAGLIMLVTLLTIIVAGESVAGEFTWGTIKLLLIRPASRTKILFSKYLATLLFALFLLVSMFIAAILLGGIFQGFGGVAQPDLYVGADGLVHERSMIFEALKQYGLGCISLLMMVTFAFMISSAFRSGSMAIGFSVGLLFAGTLIVNLLSRYDWVKYVLFANIDLSQYSSGRTPIVEGMTLGFSISVLAAYFIIFNFISWLLFTKRDVAA